MLNQQQAIHCADLFPAMGYGEPENFTYCFMILKRYQIMKNQCFLKKSIINLIRSYKNYIFGSTAVKEINQ